MCKCGKTHNTITQPITMTQQAIDKEHSVIALSTLFKQRDAMIILINTGMYHLADELNTINRRIELIVDSQAV